ncbi:MAG: PAS domain S-box protein [Nitrospinota bacterium]
MNVIKSEKSSAAKINISGRQRMLSRRTALLTRKLVSATDKARRDDIRKTLLETVSLMERSHNGLIYGDPEMNLPGGLSKNIRSMYFDSPTLLDMRMRSFISTVKALVRIPDDELSVEDSHFRYIHFSVSSKLLEFLDDAVKEYQLESEANIAKLRLFHAWILGIILFTLLAETLFIFRPMVRRIKEEKSRLIRAEKKTRAIVNTVGDGVITVDSGSQIIFVNKELCRIFQYSEDELLGLNLLTLMPEKYQKDHLRGIKRYSRNGSSKGIGQWIEREGKRKDGTVFPVEIRVEETEVDDYESLLFTASIRDVTMEKKLHQELVHAEKLSSMGTFVTGLAHELNNPLTAIRGFSEDLLDNKNLPKEVLEDIELIAEQSTRTAKIVGNLLKYSIKQKEEKTPLCLNDVAESAVNLQVFRLLKDNIEVKAKLLENLPYIRGDADRLRHAFENIILNAHYEMKKANDKGVLEIETKKVGNEVYIIFQNNGPAIEEKHLKKLFDPFFTTREEGEGAGLGLYISHIIIRDHGGRIWAENQTEDGARFVVALPVHKEMKTAAEPVEP